MGFFAEAQSESSLVMERKGLRLTRRKLLAGSSPLGSFTTCRVLRGPLQVNTSLQTLSLTNNSLGAEGAKALADMLKARAGPCLLAAFGKDLRHGGEGIRCVGPKRCKKESLILVFSTCRFLNGSVTST